MPPAVITLQFDPTLDVSGHPIRWETLALAGVIVLALVLAAWLAGRASRPQDVGTLDAADPSTPVAESSPDPAAPPVPPSQTPVMAESRPALRRDDLLYMAIGAIPGAVIGGRVFYALDFFDYYFRVDTPQALLDPGRGTLSLLGAVVGGTLTAAYVGWLIGAPLRRWLDVAIVPLLLGIGLGKFAMLLGGGGQGAISDVSWAVAFAGGGPWRSLGADLPAHPSQVYEGIWALAGILVVGLFALPFVRRAMPDRGRAPGSLFGLGLGWWLLGRFVIGFTWRDDHVLGALNTEQLLALASLLGLALILVFRLRPRRSARLPAAEPAQDIRPA